MAVPPSSTELPIQFCPSTLNLTDLLEMFPSLAEKNKPLKHLFLHSPLHTHIPVVLSRDDMAFLTGQSSCISSETEEIFTSACRLSRIFWQFCIPKSHFSISHFLPLFNSFFLLFRILTKANIFKRELFFTRSKNISLVRPKKYERFVTSVTWHTYL